MDIQAISTICSSMGFPIVMCLLMFNYIKTEQKDTREMITTLKDSVDKLTETIKERDKQ